MCPYPEQHEASSQTDTNYFQVPIILRHDVLLFSIPFSLDAQTSSKRGGNDDSNCHRKKKVQVPGTICQTDYCPVEEISSVYTEGPGKSKCQSFGVMVTLRGGAGIL